MSSNGFFYYEDEDEDEENPYRDYEPRIPQCNRCGSCSVEWLWDGRWVLYNLGGQTHDRNCVIVHAADFDDLTKEKK